MKINMIKQAGGVLVPASDIDAETLTKFKTGELYQIEIKRSRNPKFHAKTFAFFNFCFEYWASGEEFMDERGQFEVFRKNLTVNAGFYDSFFNLKGEVRIEAKSLAYGNMEPEEFEQHYNALINAAIKYIFSGCDSGIEQQLLEFF